MIPTSSLLVYNSNILLTIIAIYSLIKKKRLKHKNNNAKYNFNQIIKDKAHIIFLKTNILIVVKLCLLKYH